MPPTAMRVACVRPPAKLNLFLELLARRPDGFHELDTVMVPIDWCDQLRIRRREEPGIDLQAGWLPAAEIRRRQLGVPAGSPEADALLGLPEAPSNLVHRALSRFSDRFGLSGGFHVHLSKRIPAGAGMGGASSDAASALIAAAQLCGISTTHPDLVAVASQLGSDVPFFLGVGRQRLRAARARGRGERIEPVELGRPLSVVVVFPNHSLSTAMVYQACDVPAEPRRAEPVIRALQRGCLKSIAESAINRLSAPAAEMAPQIDEIVRILWHNGLIGCQLTGSGSACFGLARSVRQARHVAETLRGQLQPGALVMAARTISVPPPVDFE